MSAHAPRSRRARLLLVALVGVALAGGAARAEPPLEFSPEFPVSAAMAERIRFWVRVFTAVSHTEAVLHDRDDVRIAYDVVPFSEPGGTVDAARGSYERLLVALAVEGPWQRLLAPPPDRVRVRELFVAAGAGPESYARAIGRIRAQRGLKEIFADSLVRSELYLPAIRKIFREAGLPAELVFLPHVESSFNPNAVSRAGAAGLWQLTRATAERHLKITGAVDARFDPVRSTAAAAEHLARARAVLGSWPLAVASYNHGVAGIARARAAVGSDSLDDILRGYEAPSFGFASRNFYPEFLAATHVARHSRYYFPDLKPTPVLQYVVRPGDSLWKIARKHRVSVRALVAANNLGRGRLQQGQRLMIRL